MILPVPPPSHTVNVGPDSLLPFFDFIGKFIARKKFAQNELIDHETLENTSLRMDKPAMLRHKGPDIYKESR